ncbi:MAG TPA: family 1 glycosylhydrolase [Acidimicrobiales bacterium]|jgi:beta-glucosidase|nr:family 1 glycosylhydrolase [Acidimicrobiales bacterium]
MGAERDGTLQFPDGFLWGAAGSAHQIEGGNTNNDWWDFEHAPGSPCVESSGDACDSFHRWPEDIDLVADMGLGSYRFSLEWSRIEPAEGEFSTAALDHYRRMCAACHERNIVPVVTFHHFTSPSWLAARGCFEALDAPDRFARYVERAGAHLGDLIGWACTINEPNVIGAMGYTIGEYPPGVKDDLARHLAVNEAMVRAHRLSVDALRSGPGTYPVGLTLSMAEIVADEGGEFTRDVAEDILEDTFLRATEGDDFVGVQAYTRMHFGPEGVAPDDPSVGQTQMGIENWPHAVAHCVRRTAAFTGLPVLITESGIATEDDTERIDYIDAVLREVHGCIDEGLDVRGYFVWSLLDNFEWNMGYGPKLGLHAVDRTTFERQPKPSAAWFADVARTGRLGSAGH